MAITYVSSGSAATGASGNVTPVTGSGGLQNNDLLVLLIHNRDTVVPSVNNSYTRAIAGSGSDTINYLGIWWKRTTGTEGTTTVTHTNGDSIIAAIHAYRGCITTGNPFNTSGSIQNNTGTPISTTSITTSVGGCKILHVFGSKDNNAWGLFGGACTTGRLQTANGGGTDNSLGLVEGSQTNAGATGISSGSQTSVGPDAGVSVQMAITPAATTYTNVIFQNTANSSVIKRTQTSLRTNIQSIVNGAVVNGFRVALAKLVGSIINSTDLTSIYRGLRTNVQNITNSININRVLSLIRSATQNMCNSIVLDRLYRIIFTLTQNIINNVILNRLLLTIRAVTQNIVNNSITQKLSTMFRTLTNSVGNSSLVNMGFIFTRALVQNIINSSMLNRLYTAIMFISQNIVNSVAISRLLSLFRVVTNNIINSIILDKVGRFFITLTQNMINSIDISKISILFRTITSNITNLIDLIREIIVSGGELYIRGLYQSIINESVLNQTYHAFQVVTRALRMLFSRPRGAGFLK